MRVMDFITKYKYQITIIFVSVFYFTLLIYTHDATYADYQSFVLYPFQASYGFDRWHDWSSRLFIESAVNLFSKSLLAWKLATVIFGVVFFWSFNRILDTKRLWQVVILMGIIMLINWNILSTAGIFATTINYLWPMACLMFVAAMILRPFEYKTTRAITHILIFPAFIFAMCSEQLAVLALVLSIVYIADRIVRKKEVSTTLWVLLVLSVAGVVNVLVAPGNALRNAAEVKNSWPGFDHLPLTTKLVDGIIALFSRLFLAPEVMAIIMTFALALLAYVRRNIRAFAALLPACVLVILFFFPATNDVPNTYIRQGNYFNDLRVASYAFVPGALPSKHDAIVYVALAGVVVVSILIGIYYLYAKTRKAFLILLLLCTGIVTAMAASLSPTLFDSGTRTMYVLVIIMAGINFVIVQDILKQHFETPIPLSVRPSKPLRK